MPLIAAGLTAVGSIASGLIGSHAASSAGKAASTADLQASQKVDAATQSGQAGVNEGMKAATDSLIQNGTAANGVLGNVYNNLNGKIDPYLAAGQTGLNSLVAALAPGGTLSKQFAFNPKDLESDPGYQFQLTEGLKALQNSAAARGGLGGGGTLKSVENYSQGLAGTSFGNAYNRALNTFQTNRNNTLGSLMALTGVGQNAINQSIGVGENYGNATSNNYMNLGSRLGDVAMQGNEFNANLGLQGANLSGNFLTRMGDAQAAGIAGAGNAWGNAVNGVAGAAGGYFNNLTPAVTGAQPAGYTPPSVATLVPPAAWGSPPALPAAPVVPAYPGGAR